MVVEIRIKHIIFSENSRITVEARCLGRVRRKRKAVEKSFPRKANGGRSTRHVEIHARSHRVSHTALRISIRVDRSSKSGSIGGLFVEVTVNYIIDLFFRHT